MTRPGQVGVEGFDLFKGLGEPFVDDTGTRRIDFIATAPRARTTDPQTSHDAARSMREAAKAQQDAILAYLEAHPEGATADELDRALGWDRSVAGRRVGELIVKGDVIRTTQRRETRTGREAFVVVLAKFGQPK